MYLHGECQALDSYLPHWSRHKLIETSCQNICKAPAPQPEWNHFLCNLIYFYFWLQSDLNMSEFYLVEKHVSGQILYVSYVAIKQMRGLFNSLCTVFSCFTSLSLSVEHFNVTPSKHPNIIYHHDWHLSSFPVTFWCMKSPSYEWTDEPCFAEEAVSFYYLFSTDLHFI